MNNIVILGDIINNLIPANIAHDVKINISASAPHGVSRFEYSDQGGDFSIEVNDSGIIFTYTDDDGENVEKFGTAASFFDFFDSMYPNFSNH